MRINRVAGFASGRLVDLGASEAGYYLQLSAGVLLMLAVGVVARKGSTTRATTVVIGSAAVAADAL